MKQRRKCFLGLRQTIGGKPLARFFEGRQIAENIQPQFVMSLPGDEGLRYYEFRRTELMEGSDSVGRVYMFLDITEKQDMIDKLKPYG